MKDDKLLLSRLAELPETPFTVAFIKDENVSKEIKIGRLFTITAKWIDNTSGKTSLRCLELDSTLLYDPKHLLINKTFYPN